MSRKEYKSQTTDLHADSVHWYYTTLSHGLHKDMKTYMYMYINTPSTHNEDAFTSSHIVITDHHYEELASGIRHYYALLNRPVLSGSAVFGVYCKSMLM